MRVQRIFAEIDGFLDESDDFALFVDMSVSPYLRKPARSIGKGSPSSATTSDVLVGRAVAISIDCGLTTGGRISQTRKFETLRLDRESG